MEKVDLDLEVPQTNEPILTAKLVQQIDQPFRIWHFENFLSARTYAGLCNELQHKMQMGLHETPVHRRFFRAQNRGEDGEQGIKQYGAYVYVLPSDETGPFALFYSRRFFNFFQGLVDFDLSPHVTGAIHHHKINSPTGWIHNDFHFCNFEWKPNAEGLNPWSSNKCQYQYGYDPRPEILKCYRSIGIIYYFGNEPWSFGDGGETCFFKSPSRDSVFFKTPPLNNQLVAFEIGPNSYHSFMTNTKSLRNSIAFWFHSEPVVALQKFNELPRVGQILDS